MNDFHNDRHHAARRPRFSKLERLGLRGAAMIYLDCQPVQAAILVALLIADGPMHWSALERETYAPNKPPASNAIRVHVSRIRRFLEQAGAEATITNTSGVGYELTDRPAMMRSLLAAAELLS